MSVDFKQNMEEILQENFFQISPGKKSVCVKLCSSCLIVESNSGCTKQQWRGHQQTIQLDDIVGCSIVKVRDTNSNDLSNCNLSIIATHKQTLANEEVILKQKHFLFKTTYHLAELWKKKIMNLLSERDEANIDIDNNGRSKKLMFLINPKSGEGRALKVFDRCIKPILEHAGTPYEVVVTQRANHGRDLISTQDLKKYGGIIIVSGDGLLHEIVQGIFQRQDAFDAIKTPLGIIPAGTGNGLARSLAHITKEKYSKKQVYSSVLNVISGKTQAMDLTRVKTASGRQYFSFLSIGWGFLADCDIESETLRFMGEPRFTLWAGVRIANLRHYRGRIHYKPANMSNNSSTCDDWTIVEDDFISVYCLALPWVGTSLFMAPESQLSDGVLYLHLIRKGISRAQLLKILLELESGNHINLPGVESLPITAVKIEPLTPNGHMTLDGELIEYGNLEAEVLPGCARIMTK